MGVVKLVVGDTWTSVTITHVLSMTLIAITWISIEVIGDVIVEVYQSGPKVLNLEMIED